MNVRALTLYDVQRFEDDIIQCYLDNLQIQDSQCPVNFTNRDEVIDYLFGYIEDSKSFVTGIFDKDEEYLFGLVIYDGVRMTDDGNSAELHLVTCKDMWGKDFLDVYKDMLSGTIFDTLYCLIPSYCRPVIGLIKKLGFKKTGYVPKVLPYKNLKGQEKMYDVLIYSWRKDGKIS